MVMLHCITGVVISTGTVNLEEVYRYKFEVYQIPYFATFFKNWYTYIYTYICVYTDNITNHITSAHLHMR